MEFHSFFCFVLLFYLASYWQLNAALKMYFSTFLFSLYYILLAFIRIFMKMSPTFDGIE